MTLLDRVNELLAAVDRTGDAEDRPVDALEQPPPSHVTLIQPDPGVWGVWEWQ